MPNKTNRASIFASFDALKGFRELLEEQERIVVEKRTLSEDDYELLNRQIYEIEPGRVIGLIYYDGKDYIYKTGKVSKINFDTMMLQLVKTKISFRNIIEINLEPEEAWYLS